MQERTSMKGLKDLSVATDNDETAESSIVNGTIELRVRLTKVFGSRQVVLPEVIKLTSQSRTD